MTDETRDANFKELSAQINKDAQEFSDKYYSHDVARASTARTGYHSGAFGQHPIAHAQGVKEGRRQAIEEILPVLKNCINGCGDAVDMFESATEPEAIAIKAEIQGYISDARKFIKELEKLKL